MYMYMMHLCKGHYLYPCKSIYTYNEEARAGLLGLLLRGFIKVDHNNTTRIIMCAHLSVSSAAAGSPSSSSNSNSGNRFSLKVVPSERNGGREGKE